MAAGVESPPPEDPGLLPGGPALAPPIEYPRSSDTRPPWTYNTTHEIRICAWHAWFIVLTNAPHLFSGPARSTAHAASQVHRNHVQIVKHEHVPLGLGQVVHRSSILKRENNIGQTEAVRSTITTTLYNISSSPGKRSCERWMRCWWSCVSEI
jgi:hypothetical protein